MIMFHIVQPRLEEVTVKCPGMFPALICHCVTALTASVVLCVCVSLCVCVCLCTLQCLIMGQGRPQAHGGPGGLRPLRFQSRAFLAACSIAVKTAKQLQQQTLEAPGGSTANLRLINNRTFLSPPESVPCFSGRAETERFSTPAPGSPPYPPPPPPLLSGWCFESARFPAK